MNVASATIRVFEHERLVVGRSYPSAEGEGLTFEQRHYDALARFNDRNRQRYFLLGRRSVRFRQYVGLIRAGRIGIEILPKTTGRDDQDHDRWRGALTMMLARTVFAASLRAERAEVETQPRDLLDLYVQHFADEVERLQREGLTRGYRSVEENRTSFKGRLNVEKQASLNCVHQERFYVSYRVFDYATLPHQILLAALDLLARYPLRSSLRSRIRRLRFRFPEIPRQTITDEHFRRIPATRSIRRYTHALALARLILRHHSPDLRWGSDDLIALLFDSNQLFEAFIAQVFRRLRLPGVRARTQVSRLLWQPDGGGRGRRVIPDVVLHGADGQVLVVDTKWKVPAAGRPSIEDLRQMYVYNEIFGSTRSILLYPRGSRQTAATRGDFAGAEHGCETAFIGLFDDEGRASSSFVQDQLRALLSSFADKAEAEPAVALIS